MRKNCLVSTYHVAFMFYIRSNLVLPCQHTLRPAVRPDNRVHFRNGGHGLHLFGLSRHHRPRHRRLGVLVSREPPQAMGCGSAGDVPAGK